MVACGPVVTDDYKKFFGVYHWGLRISGGLKAFFKALWILGVWGKERCYYWKLLLSSLTKYPRKFTLAVTLAIYGSHYRKVSESI